MQEFNPGHDKDLLAWTQSHYGGVILVQPDPKRFRNCDHILWPQKGKRIAGQPRYCFDTEAEARAWVT